MERKEIIPCGNTSISTVMIQEVGGNFDFYYFKLKRPNKGVKFFSVVEINNSFEITSKLKEINPSDFKLKPLSRYEVINVSNGDAAQSTIVITTDEQGNIIDADKTDCD